MRATGIQANLADLASAEPLVEGVIREFGKLDILVNNGGIAAQAQLVGDPDLDEDRYNRPT